MAPFLCSGAGQIVSGIVQFPRQDGTHLPNPLARCNPVTTDPGLRFPVNPARLVSGNHLGRRLLRRSIVAPAEKFLLNLCRNMVQPSLCSVRLILVVAELGLKFSHPVFGGAKLSR